MNEIVLFYWFRLVWLFNGISTFLVYIMLKPSVSKESSGAL